MKSAFGSLLCLILGLPPLVDADAIDDLRAAEQSFDAIASDQGQLAAWDAYLAADAVLFRPTPVDARRWIADQLAPDGRLDLSPASITMSCTGDLAVAQGPWTYLDVLGRVGGEGSYLTVWRRGADGEWRIVLDHAFDATAGAGARTTREPHVTVAAACDSDQEDGPQRAEERLNREIAKRGYAAAVQRVAGGDFTRLRDGEPPAGAPEAPERRGADRFAAATNGVVRTPGADIAVSYGEYSSGAGDNPMQPTVFVRLWRRDDGKWRLALDATSPIPQPQ